MGGLCPIPQPLVIAFSAWFWVHYNGIAVFNTNGIIQPPDRADTAPKVSEFSVTVRIDRVPDDVIIDIRFVNMGTATLRWNCIIVVIRLATRLYSSCI